MEFKDVKNNEPDLVKVSDTFYKSEKHLVLVGGEYPLVARFEKDISIDYEYESWFFEEYDDIVDEVTHFAKITNLPKL
ncbi:hypothetical protein BTO04_12095 [Polaribacter sp. SA4-10]|uniref:hypothetical protein n=1 Tax=Polaribacter sp. SA4-10 TaxID=754397 RepID=UPI000B3C24B2|nr:hypothetical protein [Polaribacter sp. SA4-10]ARV07383.1 hypothetical protein BTO04_12095 [Polaribacter sp. SA4-10]